MGTSIKSITLSILLFISYKSYSQGPNFEFHKISEIRNGYTLQSNGSPQQLWLDLNNPGFLHAIFINSQFNALWPDRSCIYFGSIDQGVTWFLLGAVPDTSRSGFPSIAGTADGRAVITNHSNYFGEPIRTGLYIDESPFNYNFNAYDPGNDEVAFWPKHIVLPDGNILIAALNDSLVLNYFDTSSGTFSGWIAVGTSNPEAYSFAVSDGNKTGFTFVCGSGSDAGDVIYIETTNSGITWATPIKVFDCPAEHGIAVGALRGIDLNFSGEEPCIVFETCQQDFSQYGGIYYPRLPNQILFWSPNINGGTSKVIADENNVPFFPSLGQIDVFPPLCRPVIGRVDGYPTLLFVAFSASTEYLYISTDSVTYFAGYITYTTNGGETWNPEPIKFTPDSPLLDWKYISSPSVFPVEDYSTNLTISLHFVLQADSLELNQDPFLLSAEYYHCYAEPFIIDIWDDVEDLLPTISFKLEQNYPNPFNPSTKIKFSIPTPPESSPLVKGRTKEGFVTLKVFDILGNEVATLVKEEKPAGTYEVEFDGTGLSSGIYFYELKSGYYIETKKMILLK